MLSFSTSRHINAPVDKTFAYVADPANIPAWRKDVPAITEVSGPPGAGVTFLEEVRFMGVKHLVMKVTEFDAPARLVIEAQSGMSLLPTQSFTFKADGDGTLLELSVMMRTSGIFSLLGFMLKGRLTRTWNDYLAQLDSVLQRP